MLNASRIRHFIRPLHSQMMDKRTRLVNALSLLCAAIGLLSLPFDWFTAPRWMVLEDITALVFYLTIPVLNRMGFTKLGRLLFLLFGNVIIFADVFLLGVQSGADLMFFGLTAFALMIFDLSEKYLMIIAALVPILGYFFLRSLPPGFALDPQSVELAAQYSFYSAMIAYLCIALSIYFLQRVNQSAEAALHTSRAQAIAAEKMAALGEMSGSLAHEINTPLTALRLNADLLKRMIHDPSFDRAKAEKQIDKMDSMIERITKVTLSLQRFSRNAENDPLVAISVGAIFRDTLNLCQERFKVQNVALQVELDGMAEVELMCRPVQVSQVLLNLLNNAFAAASELDTKWVRLEASDADSYVRISVTDSGLGIDEEVQRRLFEPFFTTKAPGQGTGLGLSISKGITEALNGRIYLDTASANTRFVVEFPKA